MICTPKMSNFWGTYHKKNGVSLVDDIGLELIKDWLHRAIAGPVIVYGVSASVVYGLIYWITTLF